MSFKSRAKAILGNVREGVEKDEETKERASKRREAAKARLKQAYRAIESAEPGVADGRGNRSRTQAMFSRAEKLGQASAPVDATLETMGDPGQIEAFATAGDSGTPQRQDDDDSMAADMESLVLGSAGDEAADGAEGQNDPLEFADPFGVSGGER